MTTDRMSVTDQTPDADVLQDNWEGRLGHTLPQAVEMQNLWRTDEVAG